MAVLKKRQTALVVMFLLLLSIFSIAEVEEESAAEATIQAGEVPAQTTAADSLSSSEACGFWCKISEFLFGNKENRAGKGWFDRKGALVGMAGKNLISCFALRSAGGNGNCQQTSGSKTNTFSCNSDSFSSAFNCKGLTLSNGKLKESKPFEFSIGEDMETEEFSSSKVTSEEFLWHEAVPTLVKNPGDVVKLKKAGLTDPKTAVEFSKSSEFKGLSGGTITTLIDQTGSTSGAKNWGQWYQAQVDPVLTTKTKIKENDLPKLQKTFGDNTQSAVLILSSPKVKSADDAVKAYQGSNGKVGDISLILESDKVQNVDQAVSIYKETNNNLELAQAMLEIAPTADSAIEWSKGETTIAKEKLALAKANVASGSPSSSASGSSVPESLKDKISLEEYEQYNQQLAGTNVPTEERDATIKALVDAGVKPSDLSTKVQSCSAGGECQYGDITIEVKNGKLYDIVSVQAGESSLIPGGPAPTDSPPSDESPSTSGTGGSPKPASTSPSTYTVSKAGIGTDGTITIIGKTSTGADSKHEYKKTGIKGPDSKDIYQYFALGKEQQEWYVKEGSELVRVKKVNDKWEYINKEGIVVTKPSDAKKSGFVANDQEVKLNEDGTQVIINTPVSGISPTAKPSPPPAPAPPVSQPTTYKDVFSDSLGDSSFGKKIKDKYFDKDGLKKGYTFDEKAGTITKKNDQNTDETLLTLKKEDSGIVQVSDMIPPTKEGDTSTYTHTLLFSGQEIASQTEAQQKDGKATINGNTVLMEKSDTFITADSIDFTDQQLFYADEEDKSNGVVKSALQVGDGKITYTDADEETQIITDTKNNEITESEGDWDKDDKEFTPSDGIIYEVDKKTGDKGKKKYLADYDYKDSKLDTVELFDPMSGKYQGATFAKLGDYEGVTMIQNKDGSVTFEYKGKTSKGYRQRPDGSWTNLYYEEVTNFLRHTKDPLEGLSDTQREYVQKDELINTRIEFIPNSNDPEISTLASFSSGSSRIYSSDLQGYESSIDLSGPLIQKQIITAMGYKNVDEYATEKKLSVIPRKIVLTKGKSGMASDGIGFIDIYASSGQFDAQGNIHLEIKTEVDTDVRNTQEIIYTKVEGAKTEGGYQIYTNKEIFYDAIGSIYTKDNNGNYIDTFSKDKVLGVYAIVYDEEKTYEGIEAALMSDQKLMIDARAKKEESEKKKYKDDEAIRDQIDAQYLSSLARGTQTVLSSIYAGATSVKDYPAISKVLGISDWWKGVFEDSFMENFVTTADQTFAPMLGSNWFPSALCESHWDIEPEGTAMIKTPTGTYQAIAHIEGERSAQKSPILCSRNPDQEAEQEWLCDENQVCVDNSFCYEDKDLNNKADDEEKQLTGYFYKITWGVSAPSDETFTPFIDEDGVAVSFNVAIKNTNKVEPLYNKEGDIDGPIELKNGDSDMDVILHYSPNLFTEVCIQWENAPASVEQGGSALGYLGPLGAPIGAISGANTGTEPIGDVCFDLVTSSVGEVNWESGGKPASTKASDPKVSLSTGW